MHTTASSGRGSASARRCEEEINARHYQGEHCMRAVALSVIVAILLCACAAPTPLRSSSAEGALQMVPAPDAGDDLVGIAISGGGSRAATFASYVLEELARIDVSPQRP